MKPGYVRTDSTFEHLGTILLNHLLCGTCHLFKRANTRSFGQFSVEYGTNGNTGTEWNDKNRPEPSISFQRSGIQPDLGVAYVLRPRRTNDDTSFTTSTEHMSSTNFSLNFGHRTLGQLRMLTASLDIPPASWRHLLFLYEAMDVWKAREGAQADGHLG